MMKCFIDFTGIPYEQWSEEKKAFAKEKAWPSTAIVIADPKQSKLGRVLNYYCEKKGMMEAYLSAQFNSLAHITFIGDKCCTVSFGSMGLYGMEKIYDRIRNNL